LGYAITAHRAQGVTTDTSHTIVSPATTRENLYVALTRGRLANHAWVATDQPDPNHTTAFPGDQQQATAVSVLHGVLRHSGAELSAHHTVQAEAETWGSIAQLADEYEELAQAAQHDRWAALVSASTDPATASRITESEAFGVLCAELRRAEANHHNLDRLLPKLTPSLATAEDPAAVLRSRLLNISTRPAKQGGRQATPRLIVGLIPEATGPMSAEMRRALSGRRDLLRARALTLVDRALQENQPWITHLGQPPTGGKARRHWTRRAATIAAYRDRWAITTDDRLGPKPESTNQRLDRERAKTALLQTSRQPVEKPVTALEEPGLSL
jgi:hypothetical protein